MLKKIAAAAVIIGLTVSLGACKKKEEQPQLPPGHPSMEGGNVPPMPDMPKVDRQVLVPKSVQAKYHTVKLSIEDKATRAVKEYSVAIGSELAVPNSKIKVKVLAFLPDFRMGDKDITSASDKPNNPAAQLLVQEPGKEDWKGFIYSMHPGIHPYQHEKIAITLIGGA
jgi:hypothetical protein